MKKKKVRDPIKLVQMSGHSKKLGSRLVSGD
jgi:hypothetical protein